MSIRRNRNGDRPSNATAVAEPPAIEQPLFLPRIEGRKPSEMNGYLDPDQTLVNFAIREKGMSFQQLIAEDPSRLLRTWLKLYRNARGAAIGTAVLGAAGMVIGVGTGATPLMVAGLAVIGGSGLLAKHHNSGVKACELEAEILDEIRPILELFHTLESRGANPSDLVSLYDRLIRQYAAQNPIFGAIGNPAGLKDFFEVELAKHLAISSVAATQTGFTVAAKPQTPAIAPITTTTAPAEIGSISTNFTTPAPVDSQPEGETPELPTTDLAGAIAEKLKSLLIAAAPRAGKGFVVAHAGREAKERLPYLEIWLLDPKNEPSESGYWSFIDLKNRLHFNLRSYSVNVAEVEESCDAFLNRFNASQAKAKLLIVDEFVSLNSRLSNKFMGRLKDFLVSVSSSGEVGTEEQGTFAWIVTQSPYTKDVGMSTKGLMAAFNRALIFSKANAGYLDLASDSAEFCPKIREEQKQTLLAPTGRAFYYSVGDRWGALCNYQGFTVDPKTSEKSHPFKSANPQIEDTKEQAEVIKQETAVGLMDAEEIASKLLNWLNAKGQDYFENEIISGSNILKHFNYWSDGKTRRVNKQELILLIRTLARRKDLEIISGKGVKLISFDDELGLFGDEA